MTEPNRLHFEVVGSLSCQAILGASWAACPAWRDLATTQCHFTVAQIGSAHTVVEATSQLTLTKPQALQQFPQLSGLATGDWPATASAAEWESLALIQELARSRNLAFSFGALPLPTNPAAAEAPLLLSAMVDHHWLTRSGLGSEQHSLLAVSVWGGREQSKQDNWQLSCFGYGQRHRQGNPDILAYGGWCSSHLQDQVVVLAANIDDQNPELYQDGMEALFAAGALDVLLQPVVMKKQRPGILLSVVCRLPDAERLAEVIFQQTSTLGIRRTLADRYMLERRSVAVTVLGSTVRVKLGYHGSTLQNVAPEYEDCRRVSAATGVPVKVVYQQAVAAFWQSSSTREG